MIDYLSIIRGSGKSYRELERISGVNQNTIRMWVTRGKSPYIGNVEAVLNSLGYSIKIESLNEADNENN